MLFRKLLAIIRTAGLLGALTFVASYPLAGDDWICTEAAARRESRETLLVCGVGLGPSISAARQEALQHAKTEFHGLCEEDTAFCKGHEVSVEPLRTSCKTIPGDRVQCFRGLRYTISERLSPPTGTDFPEVVNQDRGASISRKIVDGSKAAIQRKPVGEHALKGSKDRQIILASVPSASEIRVIGHETRVLKPKENPATILIHQRDQSLLVYGPPGYKPRKVLLQNSTESSDDFDTETLEVYLERR